MESGTENDVRASALVDLALKSAQGSPKHKPYLVM